MAPTTVTADLGALVDATRTGLHGTSHRTWPQRGASLGTTAATA